MVMRGMNKRYRKRQMVNWFEAEALEARQLLSASLKAGVLRVNGTGGDDVISITKSKSNIVVKIGNKPQSFAASKVNSISLDAGDGNDKVTIARQLKVTTGILGGGGNDTLNGGSGMDLIEGGDGDDLIHGGAGNDLLYGDGGNDTLLGQAGNDTIGGDANEQLWFKGEAMPDLQAGNDVVNGGDGDDWLLGGLGSDTITTASNGMDTFTGGDGKDIIDARTQYTYNANGDASPVSGTEDTITDLSNADTVPQQDDHHVLDIPNNHPSDLTGQETDYQVHIHAHLHMFVKVNGTAQQLEIPIGVGDFFLSPTFHTHTDDGTIHMHDMVARNFHLPEFFKNLSFPVSTDNFGSLIVDKKHPLKMFVKHQGSTKWIRVKSIAKYTIQGDADPANGDNIKIVYG